MRRVLFTAAVLAALALAAPAQAQQPAQPDPVAAAFGVTANGMQLLAHAIDQRLRAMAEAQAKREAEWQAYFAQYVGANRERSQAKLR